MPFRSCALSHPGMRRDANEDSFCARPDLGLFVVADGLGGHPGGQVASRLVVEAFEATIAGTLDPVDIARYGVTPSADCEQRTRDAFHVAYQRLALVAGEAAELHGMATTVAAVLFDDERGDRDVGQYGAIVAHVGDSRVYRLHDGRLGRLTSDHSWVEEQIRAGLLEQEAAREHPWRSLITRAVSSSDEEDKPDIHRVTLSAGDRLLVCSDGLSSVLTDDQIAAALGQQVAVQPEEAICESLVHMANLAGGPDNITVIVVSL
jgi:serine/threonine protein phosphatase PrpC